MVTSADQKFFKKDVTFRTIYPQEKLELLMNTDGEAQFTTKKNDSNNIKVLKGEYTITSNNDKTYYIKANFILEEDFEDDVSTMEISISRELEFEVCFIDRHVKIINT